MIRAFVAIAPPDEVAAALVTAQAGLPVGRPVDPDSLHLTLAFLGEHPEPVVEDVHYGLEAIRHAVFALQFAGLGLLGDRRTLALCAEVAPEPALDRLRDKVLHAAREAGLMFERRRYRPHLTLARANAGLAGEEAERMRSFAARGAHFRAGPFLVDEFRLVQSRLGRAGPVYDTLAVYPMKGGAGSSDLS